MPQISPNKLPKLLLVAEHASAVFGGEALIPFQYFKHFRDLNVDVHLLVHERTRNELQTAFPRDLDRLHFVRDSRLNIWCDKIRQRMRSRLLGFVLGAISHVDTQIRQFFSARTLVRKHQFDLIHEPIPVSPKLPSMLFGFSVPVIVGPMNGGMDYPPNYNLDSRIDRLMRSCLRSTAGIANFILPGKRQAALLLVANRRTFDALPGQLKAKRVLEFVENGVDLELFTPRSKPEITTDFHIICIARLVDFKRIDLLIDACSRLKDKIEFRVDVVGDGPLRADLESQAHRLGLTTHVQFHGWLPHIATAAILRKADVMVLPSMEECGGAVVLEAMATAIPVIAAKWGGPADYITPDTGILVPPATPDQFIDELAKAMLWMAENPKARAEMGHAGRQRAADKYDWRAKVRALLTIYEDVLGYTASPVGVADRL